jgi:hypothetical protein
MTALPFDEALAGVEGHAMTIVYGGNRWYLCEDSVQVHSDGEDPQPVALEALPLPVARMLEKLRRALVTSAP